MRSVLDPQNRYSELHGQQFKKIIDEKLQAFEQKFATREDLEQQEQRITENINIQMRQLKEDLISVFDEIVAAKTP